MPNITFSLKGQNDLINNLSDFLKKKDKYLTITSNTSTQSTPPASTSSLIQSLFTVSNSQLTSMLQNEPANVQKESAEVEEELAEVIFYSKTQDVHDIDIIFSWLIERGIDPELLKMNMVLSGGLESVVTKESRVILNAFSEKQEKYKTKFDEVNNKIIALDDLKDKANLSLAKIQMDFPKIIQDGNGYISSTNPQTSGDATKLLKVYLNALESKVNSSLELKESLTNFSGKLSKLVTRAKKGQGSITPKKFAALERYNIEALATIPNAFPISLFSELNTLQRQVISKLSTNTTLVDGLATKINALEPNYHLGLNDVLKGLLHKHKQELTLRQAEFPNHRNSINQELSSYNDKIKSLSENGATLSLTSMYLLKRTIMNAYKLVKAIPPLPDIPPETFTNLNNAQNVATEKQLKAEQDVIRIETALATLNKVVNAVDPAPNLGHGVAQQLLEKHIHNLNQTLKLLQKQIQLAKETNMEINALLSSDTVATEVKLQALTDKFNSISTSLDSIPVLPPINISKFEEVDKLQTKEANQHMDDLNVVEDLKKRRSEVNAISGLSVNTDKLLKQYTTDLNSLINRYEGLVAIDSKFVDTIIHEAAAESLVSAYVLVKYNIQFDREGNRESITLPEPITPAIFTALNTAENATTALNKAEKRLENLASDRNIAAVFLQTSKSSGYAAENLILQDKQIKLLDAKTAAMRPALVELREQLTTNNTSLDSRSDLNPGELEVRRLAFISVKEKCDAIQKPSQMSSKTLNEINKVQLADAELLGKLDKALKSATAMKDTITVKTPKAYASLNTYINDLTIKKGNLIKASEILIDKLSILNVSDSVVQEVMAQHQVAIAESALPANLLPEIQAQHTTELPSKVEPVVKESKMGLEPTSTETTEKLAKTQVAADSLKQAIADLPKLEDTATASFGLLQRQKTALTESLNTITEWIRNPTKNTTKVDKLVSELLDSPKPPALNFEAIYLSECEVTKDIEKANTVANVLQVKIKSFKTVTLRSDPAKTLLESHLATLMAQQLTVNNTCAELERHSKRIDSLKKQTKVAIADNFNQLETLCSTNKNAATGAQTIAKAAIESAIEPSIFVTINNLHTAAEMKLELAKQRINDFKQAIIDARNILNKLTDGTVSHALQQKQISELTKNQAIASMALTELEKHFSYFNDDIQTKLNSTNATQLTTRFNAAIDKVALPDKSILISEATLQALNNSQLAGEQNILHLEVITSTITTTLKGMDDKTIVGKLLNQYSAFKQEELKAAQQTIATLKSVSKDTAVDASLVNKQSLAQDEISLSDFTNLQKLQTNLSGKITEMEDVAKGLATIQPDHSDGKSVPGRVLLQKYHAVLTQNVSSMKDSLVTSNNALNHVLTQPSGPESIRTMKQAIQNQNKQLASISSPNIILVASLQVFIKTQEEAEVRVKQAEQAVLEQQNKFRQPIATGKDKLAGHISGLYSKHIHELETIYQPFVASVSVARASMRTNNNEMSQLDPNTLSEEHIAALITKCANATDKLIKQPKLPLIDAKEFITLNAQRVLAVSQLVSVKEHLSKYNQSIEAAESFLKGHGDFVEANRTLQEHQIINLKQERDAVKIKLADLQSRFSNIDTALRALSPVSKASIVKLQSDFTTLSTDCGLIKEPVPLSLDNYTKLNELQITAQKVVEAGEAAIQSQQRIFSAGPITAATYSPSTRKLFEQYTTEQKTQFEKFASKVNTAKGKYATANKAVAKGKYATANKAVDSFNQAATPMTLKQVEQLNALFIATTAATFTVPTFPDYTTAFNTLSASESTAAVALQQVQTTDAALAEQIKKAKAQLKLFNVEPGKSLLATHIGILEDGRTQVKEELKKQSALKESIRKLSSQPLVDIGTNLAGLNKLYAEHIQNAGNALTIAKNVSESAIDPVIFSTINELRTKAQEKLTQSQKRVGEFKTAITDAKKILSTLTEGTVSHALQQKQIIELTENQTIADMTLTKLQDHLSVFNDDIQTKLNSTNATQLTTRFNAAIDKVALPDKSIPIPEATLLALNKSQLAGEENICHLEGITSTITAALKNMDDKTIVGKLLNQYSEFKQDELKAAQQAIATLRSVSKDTAVDASLVNKQSLAQDEISLSDFTNLQKVQTNLSVKITEMDDAAGHLNTILQQAMPDKSFPGSPLLKEYHAVLIQNVSSMNTSLVTSNNALNHIVTQPSSPDLIRTMKQTIQEQSSYLASILFPTTIPVEKLKAIYQAQYDVYEVQEKAKANVTLLNESISKQEKIINQAKTLPGNITNLFSKHIYSLQAVARSTKDAMQSITNVNQEIAHFDPKNLSEKIITGFTTDLNKAVDKVKKMSDQLSTAIDANDFIALNTQRNAAKTKSLLITTSLQEYDQAINKAELFLKEPSELSQSNRDLQRDQITRMSAERKNLKESQGKISKLFGQYDTQLNKLSAITKEEIVALQSNFETLGIDLKITSPASIPSDMYITLNNAEKMVSDLEQAAQEAQKRLATLQNKPATQGYDLLVKQIASLQTSARVTNPFVERFKALLKGTDRDEMSQVNTILLNNINSAPTIIPLETFKQLNDQEISNTADVETSSTKLATATKALASINDKNKNTTGFQLLQKSVSDLTTNKASAENQAQLFLQKIKLLDLNNVENIPLTSMHDSLSLAGDMFTDYLNLHKSEVTANNKVIAAEENINRIQMALNSIGDVPVSSKKQPVGYKLLEEQGVRLTQDLVKAQKKLDEYKLVISTFNDRDKQPLALTSILGDIKKIRDITSNIDLANSNFSPDIPSIIPNLELKKLAEAEVAVASRIEGFESVASEIKRSIAKLTNAKDQKSKQALEQYLTTYNQCIKDSVVNDSLTRDQVKGATFRLNNLIQPFDLMSVKADSLLQEVQRSFPVEPISQAILLDLPAYVSSTFNNEDQAREYSLAATYAEGIHEIGEFTIADKDEGYEDDNPDSDDEEDDNEDEDKYQSEVTMALSSAQEALNTAQTHLSDLKQDIGIAKTFLSESMRTKTRSLYNLDQQGSQLRDLMSESRSMEEKISHLSEQLNILSSTSTRTEAERSNFKYDVANFSRQCRRIVNPDKVTSSTFDMLDKAEKRVAQLGGMFNNFSNKDTVDVKELKKQLNAAEGYVNTFKVLFKSSNIKAINEHGEKFDSALDNVPVLSDIKVREDALGKDIEPLYPESDDNEYENKSDIINTDTFSFDDNASEQYLKTQIEQLFTKYQTVKKGMLDGLVIDKVQQSILINSEQNIRQDITSVDKLESSANLLLDNLESLVHEALVLEANQLLSDLDKRMTFYVTKRPYLPSEYLWTDKGVSELDSMYEIFKSIESVMTVMSVPKGTPGSVPSKKLERAENFKHFYVQSHEAIQAIGSGSVTDENNTLKSIIEQVRDQIKQISVRQSIKVEMDDDDESVLDDNEYQEPFYEDSADDNSVYEDAFEDEEIEEDLDLPDEGESEENDRDDDEDDNNEDRKLAGPKILFAQLGLVLDVISKAADRLEAITNVPNQDLRAKINKFRVAFDDKTSNKGQLEDLARKCYEKLSEELHECGKNDDVKERRAGLVRMELGHSIDIIINEKAFVIDEVRESLTALNVVMDQVHIILDKAEKHAEQLREKLNKITGEEISSDGIDVLELYAKVDGAEQYIRTFSDLINSGDIDAINEHSKTFDEELVPDLVSRDDNDYGIHYSASNNNPSLNLSESSILSIKNMKNVILVAKNELSVLNKYIYLDDEQHLENMLTTVDGNVNDFSNNPTGLTVNDIEVWVQFAANELKETIEKSLEENKSNSSISSELNMALSSLNDAMASMQVSSDLIQEEYEDGNTYTDGKRGDESVASNDTDPIDSNIRVNITQDSFEILTRKAESCLYRLDYKMTSLVTDETGLELDYLSTEQGVNALNLASHEIKQKVEVIGKFYDKFLSDVRIIVAANDSNPSDIVEHYNSLNNIIEKATSNINQGLFTLQSQADQGEAISITDFEEGPAEEEQTETAISSEDLKREWEKCSNVMFNMSLSMKNMNAEMRILSLLNAWAPDSAKEDLSDLMVDLVACNDRFEVLNEMFENDHSVSLSAEEMMTRLKSVQSRAMSLYEAIPIDIDIRPQDSLEAIEQSIVKVIQTLDEIKHLISNDALFAPLIEKIYPLLNGLNDGEDLTNNIAEEIRSFTDTYKITDQLNIVLEENKLMNLLAKYIEDIFPEAEAKVAFYERYFEIPKFDDRLTIDAAESPTVQRMNLILQVAEEQWRASSSMNVDDETPFSTIGNELKNKTNMTYDECEIMLKQILNVISPAEHDDRAYQDYSSATMAPMSTHVKNMQNVIREAENVLSVLNVLNIHIDHDDKQNLDELGVQLALADERVNDFRDNLTDFDVKENEGSVQLVANALQETVEQFLQKDDLDPATSSELTAALSKLTEAMASMQVSPDLIQEENDFNDTASAPLDLTQLRDLIDVMFNAVAQLEELTELENENLDNMMQQFKYAYNNNEDTTEDELNELANSCHEAIKQYVSYLKDDETIDSGEVDAIWSAYYEYAELIRSNNYDATPVKQRSLNPELDAVNNLYQVLNAAEIVIGLLHSGINNELLESLHDLQSELETFDLDSGDDIEEITEKVRDFIENVNLTIFAFRDTLSADSEDGITIDRELPFFYQSLSDSGLFGSKIISESETFIDEDAPTDNLKAQIERLFVEYQTEKETMLKSLVNTIPPVLNRILLSNEQKIRENITAPNQLAQSKILLLKNLQDILNPLPKKPLLDISVSENDVVHAEQAAIAFMARAKNSLDVNYYNIMILEQKNKLLLHVDNVESIIFLQEELERAGPQFQDAQRRVLFYEMNLKDHKNDPTQIKISPQIRVRSLEKIIPVNDDSTSILFQNNDDVDMDLLEAKAELIKEIVGQWEQCDTTLIDNGPEIIGAILSEFDRISDMDQIESVRETTTNFIEQIKNLTPAPAPAPISIVDRVTRIKDKAITKFKKEDGKIKEHVQALRDQLVGNAKLLALIDDAESEYQQELGRLSLRLDKVNNDIPRVRSLLKQCLDVQSNYIDSIEEVHNKYDMESATTPPPVVTPPINPAIAEVKTMVNAAESSINTLKLKLSGLKTAYDAAMNGTTEVSVISDQLKALDKNFETPAHKKIVDSFRQPTTTTASIWSGIRRLGLPGFDLGVVKKVEALVSAGPFARDATIDAKKYDDVFSRLNAMPPEAKELLGRQAVYTSNLNNLITLKRKPFPSTSEKKQMETASEKLWKIHGEFHAYISDKIEIASLEKDMKKGMLDIAKYNVFDAEIAGATVQLNKANDLAEAEKSFSTLNTTNPANTAEINRLTKDIEQKCNKSKKLVEIANTAINKAEDAFKGILDTPTIIKMVNKAVVLSDYSDEEFVSRIVHEEGDFEGQTEKQEEKANETREKWGKRHDSVGVTLSAKIDPKTYQNYSLGPKRVDRTTKTYYQRDLTDPDRKLRKNEPNDAGVLCKVKFEHRSDGSTVGNTDWNTWDNNANKIVNLDEKADAKIGLGKAKEEEAMELAINAFRSYDPKKKNEDPEFPICTNDVELAERVYAALLILSDMPGSKLKRENIKVYAGNGCNKLEGFKTPEFITGGVRGYIEKRLPSVNLIKGFKAYLLTLDKLIDPTSTLGTFMKEYRAIKEDAKLRKDEFGKEKDMDIKEGYEKKLGPSQ